MSMSAGPIRDRSKETLSVADVALPKLYRALMTCAKQAAEGRDPLGLHADTTNIVGVSGKLAPGVHWRTLAVAAQGDRDRELRPRKLRRPDPGWPNFRTGRRRLVGHAAVDGQHLPGDVRAEFGRQEQERRGDFVGLCRASEWDRLLDRAAIGPAPEAAPDAACG